MFKRCACPVSLTCIHTQHQAMWRRLLAVETLPDRSLAWSRHRRRSTSTCAIDRDRGETWNTSGKPHAVACCTSTVAVDLLPVLAVDLLACSKRRHCSPTRDGHQPVMTGHNARRPRTGRERRRWWRPSEASYLTVWTLNDRFFASLVHCMLRRLLSEHWRKETEKSKVFCGVVGLDGRCSAQAEQRKKPVAVGHLPGAYLSTETNLVPIRGVMKKEFWYRTHTQTRTHTHTRNENRYAWTWRGSIRSTEKRSHSRRQKFCESATALPYDGDAKSFASPPQPARTMALRNGDNCPHFAAGRNLEFGKR